MFFGTLSSLLRGIQQVSGMSGTFAPMINRYRAERAVSARAESVSWVVVGVVDYALHVEAVASRRRALSSVSLRLAARRARTMVS